MGCGWPVTPRFVLSSLKTALAFHGRFLFLKQGLQVQVLFTSDKFQMDDLKLRCV